MKCTRIANGFMCAGDTDTIIVDGKVVSFEIEGSNGCPWILGPQGGLLRIASREEQLLIKEKLAARHAKAGAP